MFRLTAIKQGRSSKWPKFEKGVIAKVGQCEACGKFKGLVGHHVIPFSVDPTLELDEHNVLVLCDGKLIRKNKCHFRIGHSGISWKAYNLKAREQAADELLSRQSSRI